MLDKLVNSSISRLDWIEVKTCKNIKLGYDVISSILNIYKFIKQLSKYLPNLIEIV